MTPIEREDALVKWNQTAVAFDDKHCIHEQIAAKAAETPTATALIYDNEKLTYAEVEARANQTAHVLRAMGVGPDALVGLCMPRSPELVIGALAIMKAGGAYVPLDPAYPADRLSLFVEDSGAGIVLTRADTLDAAPKGAAETLVIDQDPRIAAAPTTAPDARATPDNLAYVIYTSGSTGRPKGVMLEHRTVSNFFTGMDDRIAHDPAGVWLAVTSLSFDISVLELFWTLSRGFAVIVSSDDTKGLVSQGRIGGSDLPMDFSIYFWGNDDGQGPKKYELLLEAAKFADENGFCAVWTPERHFHAFGGPFPNPSVTGAAVAAVTKNIGVRAGSCVAPLHHPARIAEEWAVIDNLTNGRAGMAIASGWQPDDFVLRPENTPPNNKQAMADAIDQVRRLWRGEAVEFPTKDGGTHAVVTQPRPVSKELAMWVTTAGNPATWKQAGEAGANVLTHLLGQSIDEVADKIKIYHQALRDAGIDPADRTVTLMLHTHLCEDREQAREEAREPMKDYLRSAAGLIKQYAWAFPAFKRPEGASNAFDLDLGSLAEDELEAILEFAFLRYFEDSGLFGTVNDAIERVEQLKLIGVNEIACLIDYGVPKPKVMRSMWLLADVLRQSNAPAEIPADDFSIAAQIVRHGATHLQCTPSMARMICLDDGARAALRKVKHLMIGGEALPGSLVADLQSLTSAGVENMYGPTETTIWSSTGTATAVDGTVGIGSPIANTRLYVLDPEQEPVPNGTPGELYIAGAGVARGYLNRPDLTAERFIADPFTPNEADGRPGRMYRTGDLVRRTNDGGIDFLGRIDHQVKIRGYRIELGEIEARLSSVAGVREAVVVAREDTPGDYRLVGYVTLDAPVETEAMRGHLAETLPEHMVPAHIVTIDAFPLTPNKKVDRAKLPAPSEAIAPHPAAASAAVDVAEPENDTERKIADVWKRVLGLAAIGSKDNFFEIGGHSLLAIQAFRELKEAFGPANLAITDLFRFPTLAGLAAHIDSKAAPAASNGATAAESAPSESEAAARANARAEAMSRRRAMREKLRT